MQVCYALAVEIVGAYAELTVVVGSEVVGRDDAVGVVHVEHHLGAGAVGYSHLVALAYLAVRYLLHVASFDGDAFLNGLFQLRLLAAELAPVV